MPHLNIPYDELFLAFHNRLVHAERLAILSAQASHPFRVNAQSKPSASTTHGNRSLFGGVLEMAVGETRRPNRRRLLVGWTNKLEKK